MARVTFASDKTFSRHTTTSWHWWLRGWSGFRHSLPTFENEQQTAELKLLKECDRFSVANSTRLDLYPEILPLGTPLAGQLSAEPTFSRPLQAPIASRTPMVSRQAVGESLRMSNTFGSAYPGTTIRADASVSKGFSAVLLLSFLSTRTNRDCIARSCKACFLRVRQMTLASAGGITVAAAFSCHAFHCLERPQGITVSHAHSYQVIASLWIEQLLREMHRATNLTH